MIPPVPIDSPNPFTFRRNIVISNELIVAIQGESANVSIITEYAKKLETFLEDGKNVTHPDYYDAKQHLSLCYDRLTQLESLNKEDKKDSAQKTFRRDLSVSLPELEKKVRGLTQESYTEEQLAGALLYLSREVNCTSYELQRYYEAIKASDEREEFVTSTKEELDRIIRLEGVRLNIRHFLPKAIAEETLIYADSLKVAPEACLTTLITALSTCNKIGTQLEIRPAQGFVVSPYLFSMIVAESGSMKSPILRMFAKQPIETLQEEFVNRYKQQLAEHEEKLSKWDSMHSELRVEYFPDGKPKMVDRPRLAYFGGKSMEAIMNQFDRYPQQALLYMKDEIAGLFNDANKWSNGKGSENQDIMGMFDGMSPPVIRADRGLVASSTNVGLSIFGTIQPEVLEDFWSSVIDPDGYWSRFLYCYQPKTLKKLPAERSEERSALPGLLNYLYRAVHDLPAISYQLSDEGYDTYRVWFDFIARKAYEEVHPALAKAYSKALGMTGRLILNLHIINEVITGDKIEPRRIVPLDTVMRGINLMEYFLDQRVLLMSKLCNYDSISPQLKQIIELSNRVGWITAREVKQSIWKLKNNDSDEIRNWFKELETLNIGVTQGRGNRLKFQTSTVKPLQFEGK